MFEKLIGSMKRCLQKIIGQAKLTYDELLTAVVEAEAVINSRPLTFVSTDDQDEPLTPLVGRGLPDYVVCGCEEDIDGVGPELLNRRARHLSEILNQFRVCWSKEYVLELRESQCYHHGRTNPSPVSLNDVVVVRSAEQPRAFWKLGRIQEILVGRDSETRGAVLKTVGRGGRATTLQPPVQLLYPLEVHQETNTGDTAQRPGWTISPNVETERLQEGQEPTIDTTARRPRRDAAIQARDKILAQIFAS